MLSDSRVCPREDQVGVTHAISPISGSRFLSNFHSLRGSQFIQEPTSNHWGKRLKLARKMRLQLITLTATECRGFYSYFVQCYFNLKETIS